MNSKDSDQPAVKAGGNATRSGDGHFGQNAAAFPYDLPGSLLRLGGSHELFRSLAEFFLEDCPELVQQLRSGLDSGDAAQVERAGHSIKGLAANFGAAAAVQAAMKVEDFGRGGDCAAARQAVPELETELDCLQRALADYLQAPNP